MTETVTERPAGELLYRSAQVVGVRYPERIIELVVMPYEEETLVERAGRMVREIISRGAFDGIERRANRVKVNRDHDITRTVGRAVALHPNRAEGLVGEVKIAQTPLGDETLTLAEDGILDASAGFLPFAGGEKWETRNRVRMLKCWLGHIALVADPAYAGARVLAVRQAPEVVVDEPQRPPTPNLDVVRAWRLQSRYAELDRR